MHSNQQVLYVPLLALLQSIELIIDGKPGHKDKEHLSVKRRAKRDHAWIIAMMGKSEFVHILQSNNQPSQGKRSAL